MNELIILRDIVIFLAILVVVVVVHEGGHFIVGKLSGIRVDEFAIGFGPKLISKTKGETEYTIRALPLGGFVRLAGMTGLETNELDAGDRAFYRAKIPRRIATILAGGLSNLVFAGILFGLLALPSLPSQITPGSGTELAGLHSGDAIVKLGDVDIKKDDPVQASSQVRKLIARAQGKAITAIYTDSTGQVHSTKIKPLLVLINGISGSNGDNSDAAKLPASILVVTSINGSAVGIGDPQTLLGNGGAVKISGYVFGDKKNSFTNAQVAGISNGNGDLGKLETAWRIGYAAGVPGKSFFPAMAEGFISVPHIIADNVHGIYRLITTPQSGGITGKEGVSGPVGIAVVTANAADSGWQDVIQVMGLISLSLGFMNLLPIPFLDGGRLLFIVIEAIRRKRINPKIEAGFHAAGLVTLGLFVIYVTIFGDISRLINHQ